MRRQGRDTLPLNVADLGEECSFSRPGSQKDGEVAGALLATTHHCTSEKKYRSGRRSLWWRMRLRKLVLFWPVKVAQLLCVVYILVLTFSNSPIGLVDPESGDIFDVNSEENNKNGVIYVNGDYRPIVAQGPRQKFCLAISRMSAFSLYPVLVLVFLTKCKALHSVFSKTPLSMFLILNESHELHVHAGYYIAIDVWVHAYFHIMRWIEQKNIRLLWETRTGVSGLVVLCFIPLIAIPMVFWKRKIKYEMRKGLHYLFYAFAIGLCFHVPTSAFPNGGFIAGVMGGCMILYTLDAAYVYLCMTEKIETPTFQVLTSGVQITMPVSKIFQEKRDKGGFAYICLPWVDRWQWHAFSLFEDPTELDKKQMFMMKTGDWTDAVHRALQRNTVRPVWVQGPFPTPFYKAETYDNQILVASGIGITPALSVIQAHRESRRVNLIWMVRDAAMLEFFLEHLYLDHDGWNLLFYTGARALVPSLEELNTNVRVIKGRPNLKAVIPNIVYGIESREGLPETYTPSEMAKMRVLLSDRMRELDEIGELTNKEKLAELVAFAKSHGFLFTELLNDMETQNMSRRHLSVKQEDDVISDLLSESNHQPELTIGYGSEGDFPSRPSHNGRRDDLHATTVLHQIREYGEHEVVRQQSRDFSLSQPPTLFEESVSSFRRRGSYASESSVASNVSNKRRLSWIRQSLLRDPSKRLRTKVITSSFKPWEKNKTAGNYVKQLDPDTILSTWGILYCGGSKPVQNVLKQISVEYQVSLNMESFAW